MEANPYDNSVRYNAGVDIALYINSKFKEADYYAKTKDFSQWLECLRSIHRWIHPKLSKNEKGKKELDDVSHDKYESLKIYQKKMANRKKVQSSIAFSIYNYCSTYEMALRKWCDKLGYQMPESDDIASAAFR